MQNISNGLDDQYVQFVFGWTTPARSWSWRGAQYFGSGDDSVGQRYRVRLMAVDLDDAHSIGDNPPLADRGVPLAAVELTRVAGSGPGGTCPSP
jgi:hypothetical protein